VAEAAKVCFDHGASITFANEKPPPLYLCIECANEIHRCSANLSFHDVIHPMQQVNAFFTYSEIFKKKKSLICIILLLFLI
jgi:protein unc-79